MNMASVLADIEHSDIALAGVSVQLEYLVIGRLDTVIRAIHYPFIVPRARGEPPHAQHARLIGDATPGERAGLAICLHLHPAQGCRCAVTCWCAS